MSAESIQLDSPKSSFQRIAVVGPGLLGGSLALAIRKNLPRAQIRIWARREAVVQQLRELKFDASDNLAHVCDDAQLVILATPIGIMADLAQRIGAEAQLAEEAYITDVGSVKGCVVQQLRPICAGFGARFVGSHPMAGSEKTGLEHARADLFKGARCVVTPAADDMSFRAITRIGHFWEALGAHVKVMEPEDHDRAVARISHLPHAAASAIVNAALDGDASPLELSGGGFRDTTRIAAGAPEMWAEILLENREEVSVAVNDLCHNLSELLEFLENQDQGKLVDFLRRSKEQRDRLSE
ncbi:MAG: prephenate dehydrogenase/arogenate dehydrogenase family protein [Verrucomicrobiota bacterium]